MKNAWLALMLLPALFMVWASVRLAPEGLLQAAALHQTDADEDSPVSGPSHVESSDEGRAAEEPFAADDGTSDHASGLTAQQELELLMNQVVAAVNERKFDELRPLLDQQVVVIWHSGEVSQGPDEVLDYFRNMVEGKQRRVDTLRIAPQVVDLTHVYGNNAGVAWGESQDSIRLVDGSEMNLNTHWSATLIRQEGGWKIASFHGSVNMFDNPILTVAMRRTALWTGLGAGACGLVVGLAMMLLPGRRYQTPTS